MATKKKHVYTFGEGRADGDGSLRELLGGKGANLAEMAGHSDLRLPVPPGFTITTEVCTYFDKHGRSYPRELVPQVAEALRRVERAMGKKFGDPRKPLLFSVRSGARRSMPGMMETVLNIGLTTRTIPGLIEATGGNERFVYDAYRRLIVMYSDVVMEKAGGIEPAEDQGIRRQLERLLEEKKIDRGVVEDTGLTAEDLKDLCERLKARVEEVLSRPFPDDHEEQLWGGIGAVFASWNGKRAVAYREIEGIPHDWGTAVNVQSMVFGNMGEDCATGVAFTRDPGTGARIFYGEYLVNAQGEDVVAGIRTPGPINEASKNEQNCHQVTLEKAMPKVYRELDRYQKRLEKHYRDMQDIEFTIERGRLFMLQCRVGKRNGPAALKMALDMVRERLIRKEEAVLRVTESQLDELLHPILDPLEERKQTPLAKGLPAGPGGAVGTIAFTAPDAVAAAGRGEKVILVREETNPEDVAGMRAAQAILTARGGMTSHAALVARGWGKCCIVGCSALKINLAGRRLTAGEQSFGEGDWLSLNGSRGYVYAGQISLTDRSKNEDLDAFMALCDSLRRLKVRTNADTPDDARKARTFGAQGIGLFRTEHMFYGEHSEKPLAGLRKMILAPDAERRRAALEELYTYMKADVQATLEAMEGLPVTIRLLDPPLHEFVPHEERKLGELALSLGISFEEAMKRGESLRESNPMMGHRGVRLGVTYPEITEMQVRAILTAAAEVLKNGLRVQPEIMVPLVVTEKELESQLEIVERVYREVCEATGVQEIPYSVGTMIEVPRASLVAGKLAARAEFFSFGTNDLTQMGFGFSRDDTGGFLPAYLESGVLAADPFATLDQEGVGELVRLGIERGRAVRPDLKVGICGEHGGDAESVKFCHRAGMDYVSCSPYRVPIARLAAAQAVAEEVLAGEKAPAAPVAGRRPRKSARKPARKSASRGAKASPGRRVAASRGGARRRQDAKKTARKKTARPRARAGR